MTVTTLPTPLTQRPETFLRPLRLDRGQRRAWLADLAESTVAGAPGLSPERTEALVRVLASDRLTDAQVTERWEAVLHQYDRWVRYEAGEPEPLDLNPEDAEECLENALDRLADGTDFELGVEGWGA